MLEMILKPAPALCHTPALLHNFWTWVEGLPHFTPTGQSVNFQGPWEAFHPLSLARATAAPQACFARVRTEQGHRLMMTLGHQGEPAVCVLSLAESGQRDWIEWTELWPVLFAQVPMGSASVTDPIWRADLVRTGIIHTQASPHLGLVEGWSEPKKFEALSPLAMRAERTASCHQIWVADHPAVQEQEIPRLFEMHSIWAERIWA